MTSATPSREIFTITLLGDLMLGRLIDQCLPTHVHEPEEAKLVNHFRSKYPHLQNFTHGSPWGNTLPLLRQSNLVLGNLETSATTHAEKWPDKVFNYRMHPDNVRCLTEAGIDYVSLANNHTLDFSLEGLFETVRTLRNVGVKYAGAGETVEEADAPAELVLTSKHDSGNGGVKNYTVQVFSFSDHPRDWSGVEQFNSLNYESSYRQKLHRLITSCAQPALRVVSMHWGPNYRWQPDRQICEMAHFLIDDCAVDVVWGHSSHHVQGVEIYNGKAIIYGCGDFVDDYAVNHEFRNDLSAAWNVKLEAGEDGALRVRRLEIWPNRIAQFQAGLLDKSDSDYEWVVSTFRKLSEELGTNVNDDLGADGQIVVDLAEQ